MAPKQYTKPHATNNTDPLEHVFVLNVAENHDDFVELFLEFGFRQTSAGFSQQPIAVLRQLQTLTTQISSSYYLE